MIGRAHDRAGRSGGKPAISKVKEALSIPRGVGFCVPMPSDLLNGPILPALTHAALKVLLELMGEHAAHGGYENGALKLPYSSLVGRGMSRGSIGPAISELEAVGLIAVDRGRRSLGARQLPNIFRLTWLGTPDGMAATNEWRAVTTPEEAERRVAHARLSLKPARVEGMRNAG